MRLAGLLSDQRGSSIAWRASRVPARLLASTASRSLGEQYDLLVASGELQMNASQRELALRLQDLRQELKAHSQRTAAYADALRSWHTECEERRRQHEAALVAAQDAERAAWPGWKQWLGEGVSKVLGMTHSAGSQYASNNSSSGVTIDMIQPRIHGAVDEAHVAGASSGSMPSSRDESGCQSDEDKCDRGKERCRDGGDDRCQTSCQGKLVAPRSSHAAVANMAELTDSERRHPFWATGLGSAVHSGAASVAGTPGAGGAKGGGASTANLPETAGALVLPAPPSAPPPPPRGLFLHGGVGVGKTLLMDLFAGAVGADAADAARSGNVPFIVRRVHYDAFLSECHRRLHAHSEALARRSKGRSGGVDSARAGTCVDEHTEVGVPTRPWDAVAEMVRRLVADAKAPERDESFHAALDDISANILRVQPEREQPAHELAGEKAQTAYGAREAATCAAAPSTIPSAHPSDVELSAAELSAAEPPAAELPVDDPSGRPVSAGVLCFDEVQRMDVADASIVAGVLSRLFDAGWVLVATCNRTPSEFAASELHQQHPQARFTARIGTMCEIRELAGAADTDGTPIDYRVAAPPCDDECTWFVGGEHGGKHGGEDGGEDGGHSGGQGGGDRSPASGYAEAASVEAASDSASTLEAALSAHLCGARMSEYEAPLAYGRSVTLLASAEAGLAHASFGALCDTPLGAADYLALAQRFHTLVLTDVPRLSLAKRDQARRFISLVDQLYNCSTKLIATAAAPAAELFDGTELETGGMAQGVLAHGVLRDDSARLESLEFEGEAGKAAELGALVGNPANRLDATAAAAIDTARVAADGRKALLSDSLFTGEDETFAFKRAASRLAEMQSAAYLRRAGVARSPPA